MDAHTAMVDLIGAWALDACDADEAASLEAHLDECASCAAEAWSLRSAATWLGADAELPPPPALRERVLATVHALRAPSLADTLTGAYTSQVAILDRLLATIDDGDWLRADRRHTSVGGVVAHLTRNDAMLATDLGLPVVPLPAGAGAAYAAWREQAQILADGLATAVSALDRPVRLASPRRLLRRPLRDALVQRAFETWTHHDDIAIAVGREPVTPPPEQVHRIIDLAVDLLPRACAEEGLSPPHHSVRLDLDGTGGGEWTVVLGGEGTGPDTTIFADAVEFTRLVANRRNPQTLRHRVAGDPVVAAGLLRAAATLGCD